MHFHNVTLNSASMSLSIQGYVVKGSPISSSPHCSPLINLDDCPTQLPYHSIQLIGMPKPQRFRPIAGQKLTEARNQVSKLLNDGIIRRSNSKFAAPIHLVPKKNGTFRMVGDYRLLNQHTEPDKYPLPRINDVLRNLHGLTFRKPPSSHHLAS